MEWDFTSAAVFVIVDDISARASLARIVRAAGWQPATFASAEEFLFHPRHAASCCVVLDVVLPGMNGLELQRRLADRRDAPIVFITGANDVATSVRAMKAGAVDLLTTPFSTETLLDAIRTGLERSGAALRADAAMQLLRSRYASLTPRERSVMRLVVIGLLNKQIGGELGISEITVKAHRGQMMRKMHAGSVPDLVMMAAALGVRGSGAAAARQPNVKANASTPAPANSISNVRSTISPRCRIS